MDASLGTATPSATFATRATARPAADRAAHRDDGKDGELCALMRGAQDGDRLAYARLLKEVLPIVKRVLQSRAAFLQASEREDIAQDILLSLHAARATYDPTRPFIPWLMTIVHNRMVDNARRYARRSVNEVLVDEYPANATDESAVAGGDGYGDPEALRQAIKTLPKGQRTAIELLKLREMSLKEASAVSGMSISALKVSVHRAIKTLRGALQG
jgi:RNA polymerase sigma factor (sigma-70 family)